MIGMVGIMIQNNTIVNTVQILQQVREGEKYLCKFLNEPTFSRVVNVDEIQQWLLFDSMDEGNAWIAARREPTEPPPPPPGDTPEPQDNGEGTPEETPDDQPDDA